MRPHQASEIVNGRSISAGNARGHRVQVQKACRRTGAGADPDWKAGTGRDRRGRHDEVRVGGRRVVEAGLGSSTDAEGRFRIEKLVPGRYLVRARLPASVDAPLNFVYVPPYNKAVGHAGHVGGRRRRRNRNHGACRAGGGCRWSSRGGRRGSGSERNDYPDQFGGAAIPAVYFGPEGPRICRHQSSRERPDGRVGSFRRPGSSSGPVRSSGGRSRNGSAHACRRSRCHGGRCPHQQIFR